MTTVTLKGTPVHIVSQPPASGQALPKFKLVDKGLQEVTNDDYAGKTLLLNIFPSLDTDTCANSVRRFNQEASRNAHCIVLCISADLPFAQSRFCAAEGIEGVQTLSAYRSTFGKDFGIGMTDGPLQQLLARVVIIADAKHRVVYTQLVPEITEEPDYTAALESLQNL